MKCSEIVVKLNSIAETYGYGGDVTKFTDGDWNAIFEAKRVINDYERLDSEVKRLNKDVKKYKDEAEQNKMQADYEHTVQMEWFDEASRTSAEWRKLQGILQKLEISESKTLYHVTTPKKAKLYRESGKICKPVRGFTTLLAAMAWAIKVGRTVIYEVTGEKAYKLPDHHNKYGDAWWFDEDIKIDNIKCVFSADNDA